MSLILAIEPDRRQAAQLTSIVRHVQGAELVLADTTERALESIGNNVPDLILVPALLSPQDDAALAAALRVIATAAHVQMLTIPTFATPKPAAKKGVLSAFRRKNTNDAPMEGCDPKVFAEEIASYIERANEERAAAQYYEDDQEVGRTGPSGTSATTFDDTPAGFEDAFAETAPTPARPAEELTEVFEPAYAEATTAPAFDAPLEEMPWAATAVHDAPIAAAETPILDELVTTPEQGAPPISPIGEEVYAEAAAEQVPEVLIEASVPAPAMALDEFAATLVHTGPDVDEDTPLAAAAAEPLVPVKDLDDNDVSEIEQVPAFEDMLADFERANLPVIQEVRAEQWMADSLEPEQDDKDTAAVLEDETDDMDIDLSIELEAVLHGEPADLPEPAQPLKPFEPVVPVERVDPLPLAAWQTWPRFEGTTPQTAAKHHGNGNGDAQEAHDPIAAEFVQVLEFEEALDAETTLERFAPVLPVERVEPMPLTAWQTNWPKLEGVQAEVYQEPIAPRKAVAKPEWVELMRSLREDIARRREELAASEPVAPPKHKPLRPRAAAAVAPPQPAKPAPAADPAKKRPVRTRPIEDEWGLFDPEQCGFAALLDKLDEITVTPPPPPPRRPVR